MKHEILIIGGGAGGQAVAASILKRKPDTDIAIVEPQQSHYYQPGWTLVGGGVFARDQTKRTMQSVMQKQAHWYQASVSSFSPEQAHVVLDNGDLVAYQVLIVATGLTLDWDAIPGLSEALGQYGVTSNYRFDLAPYTWRLVQELKSGKAIFTQPPMPIKCAGAPQKAMYLSCDAWLRAGVLKDISVAFCTSGAALFGVKDYVPALETYIKKYAIELELQTELIKVDGPNQTATFNVSDSSGHVEEVVKKFDMLHVCPPQVAPSVVASSKLADAKGWVDVDPATLQHINYGNVFAIGDVANSPNAKTAAAVRKQAPVVAINVLATLSGKPCSSVYSGYGSCPLTVERGKVVLAEFAYDGALEPSFPRWLVDGTQPSRIAWFLKEKMLPRLYWDGMLKGREWLAKPRQSKSQAEAQEIKDTCDDENKRK